jgi:hypothetical protein
LSAGGDGEVFRSDGPAAFIAQERGEGLQATRVAAGWIVNAEEATFGGRVGRNFRQALVPDFFHRGDVRGVAAAEHVARGAGVGECMAEVVHEFFDAGGAGQP